MYIRIRISQYLFNYLQILIHPLQVFFISNIAINLRSSEKNMICSSLTICQYRNDIWQRSEVTMSYICAMSLIIYEALLYSRCKYYSIIINIAITWAFRSSVRNAYMWYVRAWQFADITMTWRIIWRLFAVMLYHVFDNVAMIKTYFIKKRTIFILVNKTSVCRHTINK